MGWFGRGRTRSRKRPETPEEVQLREDRIRDVARYIEDISGTAGVYRNTGRTEAEERMRRSLTLDTVDELIDKLHRYSFGEDSEMTRTDISFMIERIREGGV